MWQCLPVLDPQARPCRTPRWRWLVVGGYAAGLFALSSAPGSHLLLAAENRLVRRQRWALPRWLLRDKVLHALAFGLGTVLLCRALHGQTPARSPRQIALCSVLAALGYGIADELHQACVPQRTAEVTDVVADGLGAALAACGWLYGAPRWPWLR
jgi:VanZ family protein